jgi:hypothetical protein
MSVDNCPHCDEPLIFEDEYLFGENPTDDDSEFVMIRARCPSCKANFVLKYRFCDYEVTGYD